MLIAFDVKGDVGTNGGSDMRAMKWAIGAAATALMTFSAQAPAQA
ncbi:MAG: hypothetical protein Q8M69_02200 [Reyranella sp.]|nr:hypothetical protein [Reyranella sp.]